MNISHGSVDAGRYMYYSICLLEGKLTKCD